jgi:hypothetical protein
MGYLIRPGVETTETIRRVLEAIEPFAGDVVLEVSSGVRDPAHQLVIIAKYAMIKNAAFAEFRADNVYEKYDINGRSLYRWQQTWSRLLALGVMINPPLAARCLEDYQHPAKGTVPAGTLIPGSPHYSGKAFDISGRRGVIAVVEVLEQAKQAGAGIRDILVERENNSIHVDCA